MHLSLRFLYRPICLRVLFLLSFAVATQAQTTVRYVKPAASGNGSGSSWSNASGNLQAMINASSSGQQVWVQDGTYQPAANTSFTMKEGVGIYGGFAGNESRLDDRPAVNPLSGQPARSTLRGNGNRVIYSGPGLSRTALLDGFVITEGDAGIAGVGGGMLNDSSSPSIINCNFLANTAVFGGGMWTGKGSPSITNCNFQANSATYDGGGMLNDAGSSPVLINCSFQGNSSIEGGEGGGIYNRNSSRLVLTNCSFLNNTATNVGGIYNRSSSASLTNCVLFGNGGNNTFGGDEPSVSYSLVEVGVAGYADGGHNLTTTRSPFVSTASTRLNGCSPAINTGSNDAYSSANGPATDLAVNSRTFPANGRIDMGAYEFQANPPLISVISPAVTTATPGVAFSQAFTASGGGGTPYGYSIVSGSLPAGLRLSTAGVLSGTPTQSGSYSLTVQAQDANGCVGAVSTAYVLTVISAIRYVKQGGTGSGNSWADASANLQSQIDLDGARQVWVAAGRYQPAVNGSFSMQDGVAIYGGFAGTESSLGQRPSVNPLTARPASSTLAGNGNSVISNLPGLGRTALLDGFVITGGYALRGGGMYNESSSPTITNCHFLNNQASKGYLLPDGKAVEGGGMYNQNSSSPTLTNCIFQDNSSIDGGGIYNFNASSPRLVNCSFRDNGVFRDGGGIYNSINSSPVLVNCSFQGNEATNGSGGALYNTTVSMPSLVNCSFRGNTTGFAGTGGVLYNENISRVSLTNCVVFGNGGANTFSNDGTSAVSASYSLFETGVTGYTDGGQNIITSTPPFLNTASIQLNGCTRALNTGSNAAYNTASGPATDVIGNSRLFPANGTGTPDRIDMGAYEYQAAPTVISVSNPSVGTATTGAPFSQTFTASGGYASYRYSVVSSNLPATLSLSPLGVLSGTPTQNGSYTLTVQVQDGSGCAGVSGTAYSLTVSTLPIRYVKQGGSGTGSGNSWADASSDLQSQIDLAGAQQVWVAGGTYRPAASSSFVMKNGVAIYGGFVGTESSVSQRPVVNPTTGQPSSSTLAGRGNSVIRNLAGLNNTALLNGFLVTGGNARSGGGMYNQASSPSITNCLFQGNSATDSGGGIDNNNNSNPSITNCSFQGNSASTGGGINNAASSPVLTNCSFQGNLASQGGGMYSYFISRPSLTNCVVFGNGGAATFYNTNGGAILASYSLFDASVTGYTDGGHNLTTITSPFISITSTQLNACSPAINAGSSDAYKTAGGISTDLAGNPRFFPLNGTIDMGAYEYQANPTAITVSNPSAGTATVGQSFSQPFTASGGASPYSYSVVSGNLPASLSLSTAGVLSGTPTQVGSYTVLVEAQDANGCMDIANSAYSVAVSPAAPPAPTLTGFTASPNAVCAGSPVTFTATVGNTTGSYSFTLTNGTTPIIATASTAAFSQTLTASGSGNQSFTLTVSSNGPFAMATAPLTVNTVPVASLTNNGPLSCSLTSVTLTAGGGSIGTPTGYTFISSGGSVLAGAGNSRMVSTPGIYLVTVDNANGCVSSTSTTVLSNTATVTVSNPDNATALINAPFSQAFTASGGASPYTYSVVSGNLPASLSLSTAGVLSGTPTQVGSYSVLVQAQDANGCFGVSVAYMLTVSEPVTVSPIRYVKPGGSGTGSGNSWADASGDLQSQINLAGAQQVWVAAGTYRPGGSFSMKNGVSIYGGFVGNETSLSQRPAANPLTGQIARSTLMSSGNRVINNPAGLDNTALLDGFVITGGNAYMGGGMYNDNNSPSITNCIFRDNTAGFGAGMYNTSSSPRITNCLFQNNTATSTGGGMYNSGSSPSLANCSFLNNSAGIIGGALDNGDSSPVLINCSFLNNSANQVGGRIASSTNSRISLINCVAYGNGGSDAFYTSSGETVSASYCLFESSVTGYTDGGHNINTSISPFADNSSAQLNACAPAINTGSNDAYTTAGGPATDLAGQPRFFNSGRIDMGAYEYQANPTVISVIIPVVSTATAGVPFSQTFTAGGGMSPYSFTLISGSLPTNLSLSAAGVLSGIPTQNGSYSLVVGTIDANGCSGVSAAYVLTVSEPVPPTPVISGFSASSGAVCVGSPVTFTATVSNVTGSYTYTLTNGMGTPTGSTITGSAIGRIFSQTLTASGPGSQRFTLTVSSQEQTATATIPVMINELPSPTLSAAPSATLTCAQTSLTLTATGGDTYTFSGPTTGVAGGNTLIVNAAVVYSVTATTTGGCSSTTTIGVTSVTAIVSVTNPAQTMTTLGTPFSQTFTATGGASLYSFSLASGTLPTGLTLSTAGTLSGSATRQGSFPITVSATDANGCTGTGTVCTLSIPATRFTVLSRDPENGNLNTNTLKPYLLLQNDGGSPLPYGELTVRYWLTVENPVPLRFDINYAQMGNDKVRFTYVPLSPARQGASGYIEFSFDASAGSLAPMSNAVIQDLINKQDYSMFFQGDDYSYVNNPNFAPNPRITAYRNGVLIYGSEPTAMPGGITPLMLMVLANPTAVLTTGTTQLQASGSGGTPGYTYAFSGPGTITPNGNTATISGLSAGVQTFTVVVTDATSPVSQTSTTTVSVTVTAPPDNQPPVASFNSNQTATVGVNFTHTVGVFSDETPGSLTYTSSIDPANGFTFNPANRVILGTPISTGVSNVTITATDPGGLSASTTFSITVMPRPVVEPLRLTATANPTILLTTGTTTLSAQVTGGTPGYTYAFSGPGTITPNGNTATISGLSAGVQAFTVTVTDATSPVSQTSTTTVSVTVTAPPDNQPPVASSNSNQTATVGVNFTYTINAFADAETPASLTYTATIDPANGLTVNPANRVISGTPISTGVSSVTITATDPGGLSASTTFTITVMPQPVVTPTTLTVLSRDPDNGQLNTNTLKPYLLLQNDGGSPIPYGELTVRYWLTVENPVPLRFDINYAQMGNDKVHLSYVPISPARQGASGYIEFRFEGSAGSLAGGSSAVIQDLVNKQDYSSFSQGDDYSYVNNGNFTANPRITAYRNGTLIYGTEPPVGARLGVEDMGAPWLVTVLGNPVKEQLTLVISGASGQVLDVLLSDLAGHVVVTRQVKPSSPIHREVFDLHGQSGGMLLLQVVGGYLNQTLKVLKQ